MVVTEDEPETLQLMDEVGIDSSRLLELGRHGTNLFLGGHYVNLSRVDGRIGSIRDGLDLLRMARASWGLAESRFPALSPRLYFAYRKAVNVIRQESAEISYPYKPAHRSYWDRMTFAEFLDEFHPKLRHIVDVQLKVTAGETSDRISLFWGLVTFRWNVEGRFFFVKGGASILPRALAQKLDGRLTLDADVHTVVEGDPLRIEYACQGTRASTYARHVLLAVPASRVSKLVCGLPRETEDALQRVAYASYIPVHLRFRRRFWQSELSSGFLNCAGLVFADVVDGTKGQSGKTGILNCFIAGPEARRLIAATDNEILCEVLEDLDRVWPGSPADLLDHRVFRWSEGISYFPPNYADPLDRLRRPIGNIRLCGDYTQGAGMNDAVLSGTVAAAQLLERIRSHHSDPSAAGSIQ